MRLSRRFLLALHVLALFLLLAIPSRALQAQQSSATVRQSDAAYADQLPQWADAVRLLANKLAGTLPPHARLSVDAKNLSSLSPPDAKAIDALLKTELTRRGFRLAGRTSTDVRIRFTLSESAESYVWVAERESDDSSGPSIVSAPKVHNVTPKGSQKSLTLDARLIWTQPQMLLDFALLSNPPGVAYSTLVTLEPSRLVFYRSNGSSEWEKWKTIEMPHSKPLPRDVVGSIAAEGGGVLLAETQCSGNLESPDTIVCGPKEKLLSGSRFDPKVPGHEHSENAVLFENCGEGSIVLASGVGDWTQPDSIQGYLSTDWRTDAVASGNAIPTDGPVMVLRGGRGNIARAIVRNLKTGDYEAYFVTATCNH